MYLRVLRNPSSPFVPRSTVDRHEITISINVSVPTHAVLEPHLPKCTTGYTTLHIIRPTSIGSYLRLLRCSNTLRLTLRPRHYCIAW